MNLTILDFAMIASIIMGYFVSISLITTSFYKSRANNYLSLSLFSIASITLFEFPWVIKSNLVIDIISNFRLDSLFAATLFTYFLIQLNHTLLDNRRYKWIYLPFVGSVIVEISLLLLDLYGTYVDILTWIVKDSAALAFNVFLIFWGRQLTRNSNTISEDKRHWLLRLNLFIICIVLSLILTRAEFYIFNSNYTFYILWILLSLFLWWILYYGVFKLQVIDQKEEIHRYLVSKKTQSTPTKKKIKSATTSKVITQLYKLMEEEELYKNHLLSRLDLANRLETSESYLSQIINQELNRTIVQFVNEYRVEAAKNLLQDPIFNKYSVEAIGMEAGFKSKSAFYNAFNTSFKMSPGAFRKLQRTS
jgi:AraC-like DNA-binding protein